MIFLEELHAWMDEADLSGPEKDAFVGYAIKAAFAETTVDNIADEKIHDLYERIKSMRNFPKLEEIIKKSFDINKEYVDGDGASENH